MTSRKTNGEKSAPLRGSRAMTAARGCECPRSTVKYPVFPPRALCVCVEFLL